MVRNFQAVFQNTRSLLCIPPTPHKPEHDMKKKKESTQPEKETTVRNTSSANIVNYDLIQRMRFLNADQHITPEDSYTDGSRTFD